VLGGFELPAPAVLRQWLPSNAVCSNMIRTPEFR
jgi:hypothetical protein